MQRSTQEAQHFFRRHGNHATKASARGINLLGWELPEGLSPEEQRACMARRVTQINHLFRDNKGMHKDIRARLVSEQQGLVEQMRAIRPKTRCPGASQFFVDVARERLTKAEFDIWMGEAANRWRAASSTAGTGADTGRHGSDEQDESASPSVLLIRGEK